MTNEKRHPYRAEFSCEGLSFYSDQTQRETGDIPEGFMDDTVDEYESELGNSMESVQAKKQPDVGERFTKLFAYLNMFRSQ